MPFDMSTAKPVGGFDLSTAKPVDDLESFDPAGPIGQVEPEPGMLERIGQAFTGSERQTPETEGLAEIGDAPELNKLSVPAFKASLGLLATGDTESLKGILGNQLGAKFREDQKGNVIVSLESGDYVLNAPGLSGQDLARGIAQFVSFLPAGRAAMAPATVAGRVGTAGVASAATEAGLQQTAAELGGEGIDPADVAIAGALGVGGQALGEGISAGVRAATGAIPERAQTVISAV